MTEQEQQNQTKKNGSGRLLEKGQTEEDQYMRGGVGNAEAESQRTDAFELWCWRRFLRIPWTARRSNQSILKEINPEYSLEGLRLKLKLQYFGNLMQRIDLKRP